ncbi:unnamed protein product [Arabis nemorensis]|uniref:Uncharacterized protein n=1 Tax=Arabis nemorensis TaxID=586526 RepID=A0A565BIR3_9BRAS|nr:unnamed protein product [Arabis nemorensis]
MAKYSSGEVRVDLPPKRQAENEQKSDDQVVLPSPPKRPADNGGPEPHRPASKRKIFMIMGGFKTASNSVRSLRKHEKAISQQIELRV